MNTYHSGRSARPTGVFSFGLLDDLRWIAVSRTGRLTNWPARPAVARFIQRVVFPPKKILGEGRVFARLEYAGEMAGFDLSRFATAFINHSG